MDHEQVEMVAQIAYQFSFARHGGAGTWEKVNERANEGGVYSQHIVDRCYAMAEAILAALQ